MGLHDVGRALRDFATYLPSQLLPGIAGFLVLPILANKLTPTDLGVLALAQSLVTLAWATTSQWLASVVLRELPASRESREMGQFSALLLRGLGITALFLGAFALLLAAGAEMSGPVRQNYWLILAASVGLVFQNLAVTLYAAALRPRAFAVVEVLARVGGIALGVILVFEGHGVHGYLAGVAGSSLLVGGVGLLAAWPRDGKRVRSPAGLRSWFDYGFPLGLSAIAGWGLLLVDRYLLAWLGSTAATGIYSVGAVIGDKIISIPAYAFFTAARPLLFKAMEERGRGEVERLIRAYTRVVLILGIPVIAIAFVVSPALITMMANPFYYHRAAGVIPIIAIGSLVWAVALFGNSGLTAARQSRPLVHATTAALVVNVVVNVALIPPYGVMGAAYATLLANIVFLAVAQRWSRRHATWRFPWSTLSRGIVAGGAGYGVALGVRALTGSPLAQFCGATAACLAVYVTVLALLGERKATP